MIRQEEIGKIIDEQKISFLKKDEKLIRHRLAAVPIAKNFVTIITGIRRCGKSVLLLQLLERHYTDALYLNFEDIRLSGFEADDFVRLQREIVLRKFNVLFFDEIQIVKKWEIFIHQLLNEGYKVFITGSNASLLSREMGTHLTGRHLSMELFPFSYMEFIEFTHKTPGKASLLDYLKTGGMPEYIKTKLPLVLRSLIDDILVRDIVIRYGIREVNALKELVVYLFSNIGSPVSANKLTDLFGIKSTTTILEFFKYLKDAYLMEFTPQFSYSLKAQIRNPKKVYAMDTGFINVASLSLTEDNGRKFENMAYLHLRRQFKEIFFFKDKGECDFVAFENGQVKQLIQVCYKITDENFHREINGLTEAIRFFKQKKGFIVTLDQKDNFTKDGITIEMIPAFSFFTEKLSNKTTT